MYRKFIGLVGFLLIASVSLAGAVTPSDYNNYKKLTVTSVAGTPTISKAQPLYLTGGDASTTGTGEIVIDFSNVSDSTDIGVFDESGNLLNYEIEYLNTSSDSAIIWVYNDWVRDGTVQAQVAYGSGPGNNQNVTAAWNNPGQNAALVYHLDNNPVKGEDSSPNSNDGTTVNGTNSRLGQVGPSAYFDGVDDQIDMPKPLGGNRDYTFMMYSKIDDYTGSQQEFFRIEEDMLYTWTFDRSGSNQLQMFTDNYHTLGTSFTLDTWYQIAHTYSSSSQDHVAYVNASQDLTWNESQRTNTGSNVLGSSTSNRRYFNGRHDAVRLYYDTKSSTWVQADYDAVRMGGRVFFDQKAGQSTKTSLTASDVNFRAVSTENPSDTTLANNGADTLGVTFKVHNQYSSPIEIANDTPTFSRTPWTKEGTSRPDTIAVDDTATWTIPVSTTASTGAVTADGALHVVDSDSPGNTLDLSSAASTADLDVRTLTASDVVFRAVGTRTADTTIMNNGSDTLGVTFKVHNRYSFPIKVNYDTPTFSQSPWVKEGTNRPDTIAVDDTATWTIPVSTTADTGSVTVDGEIYVEDAHRSANNLELVGAGSTQTVAVKTLSSSFIGFRAVGTATADTSIANNGSDTLGVTFQVHNKYSSPVKITGDTPTFSRTPWTKEGTNRPDTIAVDDTTTWTIPVSTTAEAGTVVVDGNLHVEDANDPATTMTVYGAESTSVLDVQDPGHLSVESLTTTSDSYTMRDGVSGNWSDTVTVNVVVKNTGDASVDVSADSTDLTWMNDIDKRFDGDVHPRSVTPSSVTVDPGVNQSLTFKAVLPDSATYSPLGPVRLNLEDNEPTAVDVNTGQDVSDPDGASSNGRTVVYRETEGAVTLQSPGRQVRASIPDGKYPSGTLFSTSLNPSASCIDDANKKAESNDEIEVPDSLATSTVEVTKTRNENNDDKTIELTLSYDDSTVDPAKEQNVRLVRLDESACEWTFPDDPDNQTLDAFSNTITSLTEHFSFYQPVIATPVPADLSQFTVVPNPYKPNDGSSETGEPYDGTAGSGIVFANLPTNTTVKIYTLLGGEHIDSGRTDSGGDFHWDVRNENGRAVASGWYIVRVKDKNNNTIRTEKFAIIR